MYTAHLPALGPELVEFLYVGVALMRDELQQVGPVFLCGARELHRQLLAARARSIGLWAQHEIVETPIDRFSAAFSRWRGNTVPNLADVGLWSLDCRSPYADKPAGAGRS
jgi:hypothetical protein